MKQKKTTMAFHILLHIFCKKLNKREGYKLTLVRWSNQHTCVNSAAFVSRASFVSDKDFLVFSKSLDNSVICSSFFFSSAT
jgi:hypothetical protein